LTPPRGFERSRVVALPEPISEDQYAAAAAEIESRLASLSDVVGIYRLGGLSAPGVSDIDRIVVLQRPTPIDSVWHPLSDRTRAIAMHAPFAIDQETFERHRWFAHLSPLERALGDPAVVEEPPRPDYCRRLLAVEGLVVGLLKVHKQRSMGRIKARPFLCEIHALRTSLELGEVSRSMAPSAWQLLDDVAETRRTWMSEQPALATRIRAIAERAPTALTKALNEIRLPAGGAATEPLRIGPPWGNVTLVPGQAEEVADVATPVTPRLTPRSRRLAELRWRLLRHDLAVPSETLKWLHEPDDRELRAVRAERGRIVHRYAQFIDACGEGWSSIGFTGPFLPR
jgi:hypothetical protein